jgi:hypothetical protein
VQHAGTVAPARQDEAGVVMKLAAKSLHAMIRGVRVGQA